MAWLETLNVSRATCTNSHLETEKRILKMSVHSHQWREDVLTDKNTKTRWGIKNVKIATFAQDHKWPLVLNRHDSRCTFSLQITGYVYRCSNKHRRHERQSAPETFHHVYCRSEQITLIKIWEMYKTLPEIFFPHFCKNPSELRSGNLPRAAWETGPAVIKA